MKNKRNEFKRLGTVFAEFIATRRDGYEIAYDALMREAAQKGADKIINVQIASTGGFFTRTWSGTAVAIKKMDTATGKSAVFCFQKFNI